MILRFCFCAAFVGLLMPCSVLAAEPSAEELLKPTRLKLISAGADLAPVLADIEKQTGNKLIDHTGDSGEAEPLGGWNFSLSDREFWPLIDKFLDAASLEPAAHSSEEGLPIERRVAGMSPRYGKAVYVGPFRLEVTEVTSRLGTRFYGDHRASVTLEVMWEPRLKPLAFAQSVQTLEMIADETTPVELDESAGELSVEAAKDTHAVELHIPLQLPPKQLETISSLKGRIKALVSTRNAEFRFDDLTKSGKTESDGGVTVTLETVRQNQGLCEVHMRLTFDEKLPSHVAQGSWNFQNATYLENAAGEKLDHAGFESMTQGERTLGLAYFFDVPEEKLGEYEWVYHASVGIVEVPIAFELKDVRLP
jgi:hypothetical protein